MDRQTAFARAAALRQKLLETLTWGAAVRKLEDAWEPLVSRSSERKE